MNLLGLESPEQQNWRFLKTDYRQHITTAKNKAKKSKAVLKGTQAQIKSLEGLLHLKNSELENQPEFISITGSYNGKSTRSYVRIKDGEEKLSTKGIIIY